MRLRRFLSILIVLTVLSLIYIHQQTLVFYLAYQNEQKKKILDELIDKNNLLRYHTSVFSSLAYLDERVLKRYADFQMPQTKQVISLRMINNSESSLKPEAKTNLVSRIVNRLTRFAEAKTLNP